jgi:hypothetical protein
MRVGCLLQQTFDVAAHQVLGSAALYTKQVVVSSVAQLIVEVAIFQQYPTQHS